MPHPTTTRAVTSIRHPERLVSFEPLSSYLSLCKLPKFVCISEGSAVQHVGNGLKHARLLVTASGTVHLIEVHRAITGNHRTELRAELKLEDYYR